MSEASIQLVLEAVRTLQSGLRDWQAATDRRLDAIERRLDSQDQRLTELRAELHQVRAQIMDRIDRLSDEFKAVREDVTVNFGRADRAERIAKGAEAEVRAAWDQIRAIERLAHNLAARLVEVERRQERNGPAA